MQESFWLPPPRSTPLLGSENSTYMHIDSLSIAPISIHVHRHNNQLLFCDKVANASLVLGGLVLVHGMQIEFEGRGEGDGEKKHVAEQPRYSVHGEEIVCVQLLVGAAPVSNSRVNCVDEREARGRPDGPKWTLVISG